MTDWRKLSKIDAHIHILPDEVHRAYPDLDDLFLHTDLQEYLAMMPELGIEKAVIMPLNDPWLMSMEFTVDAVHRNLAEMKKRCPGRIFAFADVDVRNTPEQSVAALRQAIDEYGLDGIKLHANNSGTVLDGEYNQPIFAFAQKRRVPLAIHCYPNSMDDLSTAKQVADVMARYPELTVIVCHMGAYQWEELLPTRAYVDMSAILPDYIRTFGVGQTCEILRRFGPERLIFASDYPDNRHLPPDDIYSAYFDALNQMDFTQEEAERIARGNITQLLRL